MNCNRIVSNYIEIDREFECHPNTIQIPNIIPNIFNITRIKKRVDFNG